MNLETQIQLIVNPQEFTRLYNAVLAARHGDDFIEVDDDRPDRGNDGYLKSERKIFAGHCFKRVQNQSIDAEIKAKMMGDLRKAIRLRREGSWQVESWTFISNYPISEAIAKDVLELARSEGIEASWRGCRFLAEGLAAHPEVRAQFPVLEVNDIIERLSELQRAGSVTPPAFEDLKTVELQDVPSEEQIAVIRRERPDYWEFMLLASVMRREQSLLGRRLLDHELGYAPRIGKSITPEEALPLLRSAIGDIAHIVSFVELFFSKEFQRKAFGDPGVPGDALRITHLGERVVGCASDLLAWAVRLREVTVPDDLANLFDIAAHFADRPIQCIMQFIEDYVDTTAEIPRIVESANGEPVVLTRSLKMTADSELLERFTEEMERAWLTKAESG